MKKFIVLLSLFIINFSNSEYYTIVGNVNIMDTTITLTEGEKFRIITIINDSGSEWEEGTALFNITYEGMPAKTRYLGSGGDTDIFGPCTITFNGSWGAPARVVTYTIENMNNSDDSSASDSKYTVSLNNDGTRLAIGEKQGTNTSTRVYEFNDDNETWEQLGDSVE